MSMSIQTAENQMKALKSLLIKLPTADSIRQYVSVFNHSHLLQPNNSNSDNASVYKPGFTNPLIFCSRGIVICIDGRFGFNSA